MDAAGVGDGVRAFGWIVVGCGDAVDAGTEAVGPPVEGEDPDPGVVAALAGLEGGFGGSRRKTRDEREESEDREHGSANSRLGKHFDLFNLRC